MNPSSKVYPITAFSEDSASPGNVTSPSIRDNNIGEIAGKALTSGGLASTALFFVAPVAIPATAAVGVGLATGIGYKNMNNGSDSGECVGCIFGCSAGVICGVLAGVGVWYLTWQPVVSFVYTPSVMKIAAAAGGVMTTIGASIWGASACCKSKPADTDLPV